METTKVCFCSPTENHFTVLKSRATENTFRFKTKKQVHFLYTSYIYTCREFYFTRLAARLQKLTAPPSCPANLTALSEGSLFMVE